MNKNWEQRDCIDRDGWLQLRRKGIGGSDVSAVLGFSPWRTSYDVWADKTGREDGGFDEAPDSRMGWGTRLESAVVKTFAEKTETEIDIPPPWSICVGGNESHHRYSPDFFIRHETMTELGEAKCTTRFSREQWEDGNVPMHYLCQLQWGFHVLGLQTGVFAVFFGIDSPLHVQHVDSHDDFIESMIERVDKFWTENVQADVPPEIDPAHARAQELLRKLNPQESKGLTITLPGHSIQLYDEYKKLAAESTAIDKRQTEIKSQMMAWMGEAETGALEDGRAVTWKTQERAEFMVKASSSRVLRFKPAPKRK